MSYDYLKHHLSKIEELTQELINDVIIKRQSAADGDKQTLSYISKKLDIAGKAVGLALDKINGV